MNEVFRIIGVGIIGVFLSILIKKHRPELALGISIATGVIIFAMMAGPLQDVIAMLEAMADRMGINLIYFDVIIKVIGIAYITQLASAAAKDAGEGAIAAKIEFGGKMCITVLAAPLLMGLVNVILELIY